LAVEPDGRSSIVRAAGLLGKLGWLGRKAGEQVGEGLYSISTEISQFTWSNSK
jgi:hypothetical protein